MSANLQLKKELVASIKSDFAEAKSIIFVDYRGITVAEDTAMRKEFRESNITYKVFKNRLLMKALEEMGISEYDKTLLEGTTAVAFGGDEIAPSKIFVKNKKQINKMDVKFGIVNGQVCTKEQIEDLAKIPSKEVLIAMLLGMFNAPMSAFARALNAISEK